MRPVEQLKSIFKDSIDAEGEDGFHALYSTQGITYILQISWGGGWEHASISVLAPIRRVPTWEEMCVFKDLIWQESECVMQFHPPKANYVNFCKYALHLWKPTNKEIPQPPMIFV